MENNHWLFKLIYNWDRNNDLPEKAMVIFMI